MTTDIFGTVFRNGTATLLARVVGPTGATVVQADVAAAAYSVYLLDGDDPDRREAVAGHDSVSLDPAAIILDQLQTGAIWTADAVGYNFRHQLDVSAHAAFPHAGRRYLVEYQLTPADGQAILVRFRLNAI
jgi:hypothetical protein